TELDLLVLPPSGPVGSTATIHVHVRPLGIPAGTPTGEVEILLDGTLLQRLSLDAHGKAKLSYSDFPAGNVQVRAVYLGDGTYNGSAATGIRTTREAHGGFYPVSLAINVSSPSSIARQPITLTATLVPGGSFTDPFVGEVDFYDGS